jgi:hypothetical protein
LIPLIRKTRCSGFGDIEALQGVQYVGLSWGV